MKLVKCAQCQQETLDAFGVCEHCGASLRRTATSYDASVAGTGPTVSASTTRQDETAGHQAVEASGGGRSTYAGTGVAADRARRISNPKQQDAMGDAEYTHGTTEGPEWVAGLTAEEQKAREQRLHARGHAVADESLLKDIREKAWYGYHRPAAGLVRRSAAFLIDLALVGVPLVLIMGALQASLSSDVRIVVWLLLLLGPVAYFGVMDGKGGTVGKRLMRIMVADMEGSPVGVPTSVLRAFAKVYVSPIFMLGYLIALADDDLRTLHDYVGVTYVTTRI